MGLKSGDSRDLAQSGWGIIFGADDPQTEVVKEALRPLLNLRRSQVGFREHYYREFVGRHAYRQGETKRAFLSRHGVSPGAADPEFMPYYLLIIGQPSAIPYEFQRQLDMQYAVGRLYFESAEDYFRYAQNVVEIETLGRDRPRSLTFFAPQHPDDLVTRVFASRLAQPLAARSSRVPGWEVQQILGDSATKKRLIRILHGEEPTGLLLTAGHGLVFRSNHPRQETSQGALLCSDWPGPLRWKEPIPPEFYVAAHDLPGARSVNLGLLSFHYSAFSIGWPNWDEWGLVSPHPCIARLPQRLLTLGVLAVVGFTSRLAAAWSGSGGHLEALEDTVDRLVRGFPVGAALEPFGMQYADTSADLSAILEEIRAGGVVEDKLLSELRLASHEAASCAVLGDPAVRLCPPER